MNTFLTLSVLVPEAVHGATLLSSTSSTFNSRRQLQEDDVRANMTKIVPISDNDLQAEANNIFVSDAENEEDDDGNDVAPPMPEDDEITPPGANNLLSSARSTADDESAATTSTRAPLGGDDTLAQIIDMVSVGSGILAPEIAQHLGPELGALLPKLSPWIPKVAPIIGSLTKGETPDFSVLSELPADLITDVAPVITEALRNSHFGEFIPEDLLALFEEEAQLLPKMERVLPFVVPIITKLKDGGNVVDEVLPDIMNLFTKPNFIEEIAPLVPLLIENSPLGTEIPAEWSETWLEFAPLLPSLVAQIQDVNSIEDLNDVASMAEKLRKLLKPVIAALMKAMKWDESEKIQSLGELMKVAGPLLLELTKVSSVEEFKQVLLRNFGTIIRLPKLIRKVIESFFGDDEDDDGSEMGTGGIEGPNDHSDYEECTKKCQDKVSDKDFKFVCTVHPVKFMTCLRFCEDEYEDDVITEVALLDDYRFCALKAPMRYKSEKGECQPTDDVCEKYKAAMSNKFYINLMVQTNGMDNYDRNEIDASSKEDSSAVSTSLLGGALFLLSILI